MQWTWLLSGLTAVSLLLGIANMIWTWFSKGGAAVAAALDRVSTKQIEHDRRIQRVEDQLPHMPSKDQVMELVTEVRTSIERLTAIREEVHRQSESIRRIEDVMLKD